MANAKNNKSKLKKTVITVLVLVIVVLLLDQTLLGGNTKYYTKWASCGSQPVQIQSLPGISWYEETDPSPSILRNTSLYCTPIEAERAGYSASRNELSFPNLEKAGEPMPR